MRSWKNPAVSNLIAAFRRYRPFLALALAVFLLIAFFPGSPQTPTDLSASGPGGPVTSVPAGADDPASLAADAGAVQDASGVVGGAAGGATGPAAGAGGPATGATSKGPQTTGGAVQTAPGVGPDCDHGTGRIMVPTKFAPPCMPVFSGDNGGATSPQGVTKEAINVVVYRIRQNPATAQALKAAGAYDDDEPTRETQRRYFDYFSQHYETYGRKVNLLFKQGTGEPADDAAGKADAIDIATRLNAFAVINDPNNAFVDELVARKVICICTTSQPQEFYEARNPYAGYTTLMSSTQGYVHRAEYVGKRLARRKAQHAGDATYKTLERTFALLYFETADRAYESGATFFDQELKAKYGVQLLERLPFTGAVGPGSDPNKTQQQAGPLIQKLKDRGVTSVVYAGDPLSPAIFTKEATKQRYNPEWIITGSALVDTSLFARTYDTSQWQNAFGISFLTARLPPEKGDAYNLYNWHRGTSNEKPPAGNTYPVIYAPIFSLFTGIHMAGPNLNPVAFQQGLFNYPVSGGGFTLPTISFGDHGIWPKNAVKVDLTAYDDVTEIWWDPLEVGQDEVGNRAAGMYRYVDGGRRYLPGKHPATDPKVFTKEGTVVMYDERPASDRAPDYPHQKH